MGLGSGSRSGRESLGDPDKRKLYVTGSPGRGGSLGLFVGGPRDCLSPEDGLSELMELKGFGA